MGNIVCTRWLKWGRNANRTRDKNICRKTGISRKTKQKSSIEKHDKATHSAPLHSVSPPSLEHITDASGFPADLRRPRRHACPPRRCRTWARRPRATGPPCPSGPRPPLPPRWPSLLRSGSHRHQQLAPWRRLSVSRTERASRRPALQVGGSRAARLLSRSRLTPSAFPCPSWRSFSCCCSRSRPRRLLRLLLLRSNHQADWTLASSSLAL